MAAPGVKGTATRKRRKPLKRTAKGEAKVRIGRQTADVLDNPDSLKEWDDEELLRGQRKDKNGRFTGRPPAVVPHELHHELVRRQLEVAQQHLQTHLVKAVEVLTAIIEDEDTEPRDRLTAIKMLIERVLGASPQKVNMSIETPKWLDAIRGGIVPGDDDDDIIDVEVLDDA